jgi:hypothetical protein
MAQSQVSEIQTRMRGRQRGITKSCAILLVWCAIEVADKNAVLSKAT